MKKRAVGYVRVSGIDQVKKGTSLDHQRDAIKKYAKDHGWHMGEIYPDEGISGADMAKRTGLLRLLADAARGKFDIMICHDIDRFGRDLRDISNNRYTLEQCGVEEHFITGANDDDFIKNMKAVWAEEERKKIRKRTMRGRLRKLKKGSPQGRLPFNRTYDKKTGEWSIADESKKKLIRWAAKQYLKGESMKDIAAELTGKGLKICSSNLNKVLSSGCGDRFINTLRGEIDGEEVSASYEHKIPPILPPAMIQAIRDRMDHNLTNNRKDVKKYVLTGFIRCEDCEKSMTGQTQTKPSGKQYRYYTHPGAKGVGCCPGYKQLPMDGFEKAVFKTLWRCTFDVESYWEAVREQAPDDIQINTLKESIKYNERKLKEAEKGLDDLVEIALNKTLTPETIRKKEAGLISEKDHWAEELQADQKKLDSLPRLEEFKKDVKTIRRMLLKKYQSLEHLEAMTYEQKCRLLHSLLDGKDENGTHYGIYVSLEHREEHMKGERKRGKRHFRFYIYARIFPDDPPPYGSFIPDRREDFDAGEMSERQRRLLNKRRNNYKTKPLSSK